MLLPEFSTIDVSREKVLNASVTKSYPSLEESLSLAPWKEEVDQVDE